jgi:outer membrane biosynthesis protein TonB
VGALVRLASLQAASGKLAAARVSYDKSGLSAQQCSLVDAKPAIRRPGNDVERFPDEARQWGFEGWVVAESDIEADGKTTHSRVIVAYPPQVFEDSAISIIKHTRYEQTYRPEGGLGCGGQRIMVNFAILH